MSDGDLGTPFRQRAGSAMKDAFLQEALTIATTKFIGLRREAFEGFPEGEALRDRARAIKEATLQRLDHHLETLVGNVERLGGHVHYAATSEEARSIVVDIARRTGARMAVKSKSMATEEIHLNEALERAGITPVERTSASTSSSSPTSAPRISSRRPSTRRRARWLTSSAGSSSARWRPTRRC